MRNFKEEDRSDIHPSGISELNYHCLAIMAREEKLSKILRALEMLYTTQAMALSVTSVAYRESQARVKTISHARTGLKVRGVE